MDDFPARIDHTALGVETTQADAEQVVRDAEQYGMNVCIPPCYVPAVETDTLLTTVIGFPHGHHTPEAKRAEAQQAYCNGCDELDMVINVGRLKAGEDETVVADIEAVTDAVPIPVKAIIETAVLGPEEKRRACELAAAGSAAFVKTSTGFADGGATVEDVALMSEHLPVKASGGVGSYDQARALIEAGAERIGASSGVQLVEEYRSANNRT